MSENTPTPAATPRPRRVRTRALDAGEPQAPVVAREALAAEEVGQPGPTDEELDRREQTKSGPRRQAGPPLEGDVPEAAPLAARETRSLEAPTDPMDEGE